MEYLQSVWASAEQAPNHLVSMKPRDGGETWLLPQSSGLSAPESMPVLKGIPETGDLLLIWNHSQYDPGFVSHYGKRTPVTAAVSRDCGETWGNIQDIRADPTLQMTNLSCTFLRTGKAVVTYFTSPRRTAPTIGMSRRARRGTPSRAGTRRSRGCASGRSGSSRILPSRRGAPRASAAKAPGTGLAPYAR